MKFLTLIFLLSGQCLKDYKFTLSFTELYFITNVICPVVKGHLSVKPTLLDTIHKECINERN